MYNYNKVGIKWLVSPVVDMSAKAVENSVSLFRHKILYTALYRSNLDSSATITTNKKTPYVALSGGS